MMTDYFINPFLEVSACKMGISVSHGEERAKPLVKSRGYIKSKIEFSFNMDIKEILMRKYPRRLQELNM